MSGSGSASSSGAIAAAASASEPTWHHTTPHTLRVWSASGNGGAGGTAPTRKKPLRSRGAPGRNSR